MGTLRGTGSLRAERPDSVLEVQGLGQGVHFLGALGGAANGSAHTEGGGGVQSEADAVKDWRSA